MRILKADPREALEECFEPLQHLWNPGVQPALIRPFVFWCEYRHTSHVYDALSCAQIALTFLFSQNPNACLMETTVCTLCPLHACAIFVSLSLLRSLSPCSDPTSSSDPHLPGFLKILCSLAGRGGGCSHPSVESC